MMNDFVFPKLPTPDIAHDGLPEGAWLAHTIADYAEQCVESAVAAAHKRCAALCDRARTDFTTEPPVSDYARGFRDASLLLAKAFRDEAQRGNANV